MEPELSAKRYTAVPFPRYRYVPGRNPHPTSDPAGHSFGKEGGEKGGEDWRIPGFEDSKIREAGRKNHPDTFFERWWELGEYLYGCDLYNHGYWWEAHEAWEDIWQQSDKARAQGRFLQALIQVSACHLKLHCKNIEGVRALRGRSDAHVRAVLEEIGEDTVYMGLAVGPWYGQVSEYYERVFADGAGELVHQAERYPYIRLEGQKV